MKLFSYFTICSMLLNGTFSVDYLFGFDYLDQQKANIVLTKAREFAENAHRKSPAPELMNFMRAHKKGAFGVTDENALELHILYDLQNELGALGYTVTQKPNNTGFSYEVKFNPLQYAQNKAGNVNPIGQTKQNHSLGNKKQKNRVNVRNNGELNSLKNSIDKLSNVIRTLSQSVDSLNERLDKNDDDNDQDDQND